MISLQLQDNILEVGETLTGQFRWTGTATPKAINLRVCWRTEGRGTVDTEAIYTNAFVGTTSFTFSCKLPPIGPISYDGQILRVIWEVRAAADFPGLFRRKEEQEVKVFRVVPRGA
ncbi:MAG: hypothetical protein HC825_06265 [Oscillatoriales cyanobacterium RM1_1_9]|nr:hypothetical protein [Oscillatoriales cyanobacterium SM2_3_0]NJO45706.1 hypothetical protein [Oscillatoriales cyanobacterium RM2_1_1]NJO71391.1 hypothetical protein [Oscillatoriales cyanobacterium RM1_1_9]